MKNPIKLLFAMAILAAGLSSCEEPTKGNNSDDGGVKTEPPPVIVMEDFDATKEPRKTVTFFTFTATWCGPCYSWKFSLKPVAADIGDGLLNLNFYTSVSGDSRGGSHPLVACDVTDTFIAQLKEAGALKIAYLPTALAEISEQVGPYGGIPVDTDARNSYAKWVEYPAKAAVRINSKIEGDKINATVTVGAKEADTYRIGILLVEDNVVCVQNGFGEGYNHTDVVRQKAMDNVFGEDIGALAVGETATKEYGFDIAEGYNRENLSVVVYILSMNDAGKWAISNSVKAPVGKFTDFRYTEQTNQ